MNWKRILKILGFIMLITGAFMLLPMIVAFIYHEKDWIYFLITIVGLAVIGVQLYMIKPDDQNFFSKDGYLIVALAWIVMGLAGAVPFCISGLIPDYINAVFESVSGFTTSGISILSDVEAASHSMLFWRSLTHWIGGMGVLVFVLALLPVAGGASMHIMRAEAPGPTTDKVVPKISETAKFLYIAYFVLTVAEIIALVIAKLSVFQACIISFGTLATGGFSFLNSSLATFTAAQQIIVIIFMYLAGINFSLFFLVVTKKTKKALADTELIWYTIIMAATVVIITANLYITGHQFANFGETLRASAFAGVSAMTSTGFAAFDYNQWPLFTRGLMLLVMFIGGCAGSTGGGIKVSRVVILVKSLRLYIKKKMHPRSINVTFFNKQMVSDEIIKDILVYFGLFVMIYVGSMLIVTTEDSMDFGTAFASVATAINNNGIEFKNVGAAGFGNYAWWSRIVFIIDMLIGRLEIFPIVILFGAITSPVRKAYRQIKRKV